MQTRDKVNNALKAAKINNIMVATAVLSQKGDHIVLTTAYTCTADDLLKHRAIWEPELGGQRAKKIKKWYKLIAHRVPTESFNTEGGMQLLKDDLELFNQGLKLVTLPQWLSQPQVRQEKRHSSVVLALKTKEEVTQALRKRLVIAGISIRTAEYLVNKPSDQCVRCQQYGHIQNSCHRPLTCQLCAGPHNTRDHQCLVLECKGKPMPCSHTQIKCSNCQGDYQANSQTCEMYRATLPISISIIEKNRDKLSYNW